MKLFFFILVALFLFNSEKIVQAIRPHVNLIAKSEKVFQPFLADHGISRKLNDVQRWLGFSYRVVPSGPNRQESPENRPPPIRLS